jgi:hypothetical protein
LREFLGVASQRAQDLDEKCGVWFTAAARIVLLEQGIIGLCELSALRADGLGDVCLG